MLAEHYVAMGRLRIVKLALITSELHERRLRDKGMTNDHKR